MLRATRKTDQEPCPASAPYRTRLTRRDLLRSTAAVGTAAALGRYAGPAQAAGAPQKGGTLRIGWISDGTTLDPHYSVRFPERPVMYSVYNTLVSSSPTFDIKPELARSWAISNDGVSITVQLQPNVKFHDGTNCDAAAVKWNVDFMLDPANNSPQMKQLAPYLAGCEAQGPTTVVFRLKKPYAGFLAVMVDRPGFIVSPAAWKKYGKDYARNPVGTGMYQFGEWMSDDHITLKRFDGYWDRNLPYLDGLTYQVAENPTVRDTMIRTGQLDITSEPVPTDVPAIAKSPGVKIISENPSGHWYGVEWGLDRPPFNNRAVRQALCYGVDRDEFVSVILGGRGTVAKGPTPPQVWWYNPGTRGYDYNPAKAKQLLAQAGYPNGFSAEFSTEATPFGVQYAQLLQAQLKRINVNITINPIDDADIAQAQLSGQFVEADWTLRADPDGLLRILFYTGNYANGGKYSNPAVDKMLDDANSTYDRNARKQIYAKIEQQVIDDAVFLWIYYPSEDAPMRTQVQNYDWFPDSVPRYRDLWLAK